MGYAHYQAHKGITDICVGSKEVSLAERLRSQQDFLFPQIKDSHILQSHAGSGDRRSLHTAGVPQCQGNREDREPRMATRTDSQGHPTVPKHRVGTGMG